MIQTIEFRLENNESLQVEVQADENAIVRLPRDLPLTWQQADQAGAAAQSPVERGQAIGQQCRCALTVTSIASIADRFPVDLLVALVQQGTLPIEQALLWTKYKTERKSREDSLSELATSIPSELWTRVLAFMQPVSLDTLTKLYSLLPLPEQQEAKRKAFDALQAGRYSRSDKFLNTIVSFLSLDELRHGLSIADKIQPVSNASYKERRADMLMVLLPRLAELGCREEAETFLQSMSDSWRQTMTKIGIGRTLPIAERTQLLLDTRQEVPDDRWDQKTVLSEIASQFAEIGNLTEARKTVEQIGYPEYRTVAFARILKYLPEREADEILNIQILPTIRSDTMRGTVDVRSNLCRYAAPELAERGDFQSVFQLIHRLSYDDVIPVLRELVPQLVASGYAEQLLKNVLLSERRWEATMAVLARYLPSPLNETAIQQAMGSKNPIRDEEMQTVALTRLAMQLPDGDPKRRLAVAAIQAAQQYIEAHIDGGIDFEIFPYDLDDTLTILSSVLPETVKQDIIDRWIAAMREYSKSEWTGSTGWLVQELMRFTPHMREPLRQQIVAEALAQVNSIEDEEERSYAIQAGIAPFLPESQWPAATPETLEEARIQRQYYLERPSEIMDFPVLSGEALRTALTQARQIDSGGYGYRAEALKKLIPSLLAVPPADQYQLWQETLPELVRYRSRLDLLSDFTVLVPLLDSLGGSTAVAEVAEAIIDAGKWFV